MAFPDSTLYWQKAKSSLPFAVLLAIRRPDIPSRRRATKKTRTARGSCLYYRGWRWRRPIRNCTPARLDWLFDTLPPFPRLDIFATAVILLRKSRTSASWLPERRVHVHCRKYKWLGMSASLWAKNTDGVKSTENAELENAGSAMQRWKCRTRKCGTKFTLWSGLKNVK